MLLSRPWVQALALAALVLPGPLAQEAPGLTRRQAGTLVTVLRGGTLTWPQTPEAALGGDCRLPPWLPRSNPCGGFYQLWGRSADPRFDALVDLAALPELTWADIEPEPGRFRFDLLEQGTVDRLGLAELRRRGRRGILWFMAWRDGDVPAWAVRKHGLRRSTVQDHDGTFTVLPVWRPGPRADLLRALAALGDRLRNDPGCGAVYLPTLGNASGECYPPRALLEQMEAMGDQVDGTWLEFHLAMLDTWAKHLGPEKGVWMSIDAPFDGRHRSEDGDRRERTAFSAMIDAALRQGFSSRSGGTDSLTNHLGNGWLMDYDATGRSRARHLPLRFWGDEIEEFLFPVFGYFEAMVDAGVSQGFTHYLVDDALLLRLARDPAAMAVFDERYAVRLDHLRRTAGWPPELAPQAEVALGEMDVRDVKVCDRGHGWPESAGAVRTLANQGWCLEQVEADGAHTAPALRRTWRLDRDDVAAVREGLDLLAAGVPWCRAAHLAGRIQGLDAAALTKVVCNGILGLTLEDGLTHTWAGRSTRLAEGQSRILLRTDPRFLAAGTHRVVIQVTVRADGQPWALRLLAADGSDGPTLAAPIPPGDGQLWTVSFGVPDLAVGPRGACFALERTTGTDLVVQRVRVVRWVAPPEVAAGPAALAARREELRAARQAEEERAIDRAAQVAQRRRSAEAAADPRRVDALRARLARVRQAALADPGRLLAAGARRGLDQMALVQCYEHALALALVDDPGAEAAIAELEQLLEP